MYDCHNWEVNWNVCRPRANHMLTIKDEDNESGRGASLPQSPVSHEHTHTQETHHPIPRKPEMEPP